MSDSLESQSPGLVIGAICARGGSKGVPRKNLRPLRGKPLIAHTIEVAQACSTLDRIVVSTDDEEIASVAREYGAEVPFMRPAELAQDHSSKWDVFKHLVSTLEKSEGIEIAVLVDMDTGVPLRAPEDIDQSVGKLLSSQADVVVTAYEADRNPYFNMVEPAADGYVKVIKPLDEPVVCRQDAPPVYNLSPSVYAIRAKALFEFDHWSRTRMQVHVVPRERAVDIDSQFDFTMVEHLMAMRESTT